ncbi:hypothetical protein Tco_1229967 [Tanacetum coccineum]
MADHLRLMEEPLRIPTYVNDEVLFSSNAIIANEFELKTELLDFISGNLMMRNIQEALTTIENKARVRTCRNKPQVSSSRGTSTQIDAITALTKQVEALEYHFSSMQKLMTKINKAAFQLNKNQRSQSQKDLQESPISVLAAKTTVTRSTSDERNVITSTDGIDNGRILLLLILNLLSL